MIKLIKKLWERIRRGKTQQPQAIAVVEPGPVVQEPKPRRTRTRKAK